MEGHINVICHNCLASNFTGPRYICCECENFNLCQKCKENSNLSHNSDHAFVKITKPAKIDIKNYKTLFRPNKMLLNNPKESFDITFDILNKGENNLKGCYITSIKARNDYLKCVKKVITEDVEYNEKVREANRKSQFLSGLMQPLMMFIGNLGYVAVCVVGAILTSKGYITLV